MKKQLLVTMVIALVCVGGTSLVFWLGRPQSAAGAGSVAAVGPVAGAFMMNEPILPISHIPNLDPRRVALGRDLFNDTRLSADNSVSCRSCHDIPGSGSDGKIVSTGIGGAAGEINAPTVLNCAFNFRQFWDGRADSLEDQIDGPTHNGKEMGSNWTQIVAKLSADPKYVRSFQDAYSSSITPEHIKDAIATFERSLVTVDSPFDRYLRGEKNVINDRQRQGYELFKQLGCTSCHQGMNAGGNMFQPFGIMGDYFADRGSDVTRADLGRFNVTGQEIDKHRFRVPTLRNVGLTAPYFHDGSAKTLEDAVKVMARYQIGQPITDDEVALVVEFLHTLTGEIPDSAK